MSEINNNESSSSSSQEQTVTTANTSKESWKGSGGLNALLFVGSFLIVIGACRLLMSNISDALKLTILLFMTVAFYIAGILVRRVKVLIPAGTAFLCISLAVMPFMGNAFSRLTGMSDELSWFLTSLLGTVAYIIAALIVKSRIIATISIGFIISLFCSAPTNLHMSMLWNYLAVILVSIISNVLSATLKEKIPKVYRDILSFSARIIASLVAVATVFGVFSLSGFDYTIIFAICFIQFVLSYATNKKYIDEVLARIVVIPLVLSVAWELVPAQSVSFAAISGTVLALEIIYSFVASQLKSKTRCRELFFIIPSLFFMPFCALFVPGTANTVISSNNLAIIFFSVELAFTILFAYSWKNSFWLFASYPIALMIPLLVDDFENKEKVVLIIYALEMIVFTVYYYFQKTHNKALEIFNLIFFTVVILFTRTVCSSALSVVDRFVFSIEAETIIFNIISLVIPAFAWLVTGLKRNSKTKIEIAFYLFMACICYTGLEIISKQYEGVSPFIVASSIVLCLGIMSIYRKSYWRAIVGTAVFARLAVQQTLAYITDNTLVGHETLDAVIQMLFLIEGIIITTIGVTKRRWAIFWIAIPTTLIVAFSLTKDMAFVWLILVGLALIGFAIWKLLDNQRKEQLNGFSHANISTRTIDDKTSQQHKENDEERSKEPKESSPEN